MEKTLKGKNHDGVERTYTFNLLSPRDGVKMVHTYGSLVVTAFPFIKKFLADIVQEYMGYSPEDKGEAAKDLDQSVDNAIDVVALIPQVFTWERLEDIAVQCLANGKIDGKSLDENGFCDLFAEDVVEFYVAIFYSLLANFPKYILPFLDTVGNDSTPDSESASAKQ